MYLTPEQMQTIYDALECAFDARVEEFERDKDCCGREARQRAIQAAHDVKRFGKLLEAIRNEAEMAPGA